MSSDAAWLILAVAAPLGLAAVVGLLRGYAVRVLIWRQQKGEDAEQREGKD